MVCWTYFSVQHKNLKMTFFQGFKLGKTGLIVKPRDAVVNLRLNSSDEDVRKKTRDVNKTITSSSMSPYVDAK